MRILFLTAASIAVAVSGAATAADAPASSPEGLYNLTADGVRDEHGRPLSMTLREVQREPDFSIVDIEATSAAGRSPAAAPLLVRGLCGVMLARGRKLAVAEQVSEQPIEFRITFPASATVEEPKGLPRMVLSEANCARVRER